MSQLWPVGTYRADVGELIKCCGYCIAANSNALWMESCGDNYAKYSSEPAQSLPADASTEALVKEEAP